MAARFVMYAALFAALAGVHVSAQESEATSSDLSESSTQTEDTTTEETTSSESATESLSETATETTSGEVLPTTTVEELSNNVTINAAMFATLDNAWANAEIDSTYCAATFASRIPDGWAVAEDTADSRVAIELNSFGTSYIVLSNATYTQQLTLVPGEVVVLGDGTIKSDAECPNRILLQRIAPVEPSVPPYMEVAITNFVNFNGKSYAMANNALPTAEMVGGCDGRFYKLPDGWDVAEDNEETKAVIITARFPFEFICKVTKSGRGYDWAMRGLAEYDNCNYNDMLVSATSQVLNANLVAVNSKRCGGILISSPNPEGAQSWPTTPEITNMYEATTDGDTYATLDNTAYNRAYYNGENQSCSDCCQDYALAIPEGWVVATMEYAGYTAASEQPWGTYCIGGVSNGGEACEYNITVTESYAAVRACDQRVLVRHVPVDCESDWSSWSACTACPGVQTRTRTDLTKEAMYGGTCVGQEERQCVEGQCTTATPTDRTDETDQGNSGSALLPSAVVALLAAMLALLF